MALADITFFLDKLGDAILFADDNSNVVFANSACASMFGYSQESMRKLKLDDLIDKSITTRKSHHDLVKDYMNSNEPAKEMMARTDMPCLHADGSLFYSRISIAHVDISGTTYGVATLHDHTSIRNTLSTLKEKSYVDCLTGLYNRYFLDEISQYKHGLLGEWKSYGLLYLDLDKFKPINDSLGHDIGDAVLKTIALRLKELSRNTDLIFRIGGDEFLILINLSDAIVKVKALTQIGQKITESITSPLKIQNHEFELGISIGAGIYPSDADNLSELIKLADKAMYYSKDQGSVLTFVDEINH